MIRVRKVAERRAARRDSPMISEDERPHDDLEDQTVNRISVGRKTASTSSEKLLRLAPRRPTAAAGCKAARSRPRRRPRRTAAGRCWAAGRRRRRRRCSMPAPMTRDISISRAKPAMRLTMRQPADRAGRLDEGSSARLAAAPASGFGRRFGRRSARPSRCRRRPAAAPPRAAPYRPRRSRSGRAAAAGSRCWRPPRR